MMKRFPILLGLLALIPAVHGAETAKKKILFFSKSSGYEHDVISYKKGQPSFAEKQLLELGTKHGWDFTFSKDGSKFSKDYLDQFDAVFFYTTGDLCSEGTDKQPPMTQAGKQALFDYVKAGHGFIGTHSASDSFHTANESQKGPDRYANHGDKADPYVRFLGGEFIIHGAQQAAKVSVVDSKFPGCGEVPKDFSFMEEWYSLKDFNSDIHVISVIDSPSMKGAMYERPVFPNTWARKEGKGRVWYTAMGHREDVWTNPIFQSMISGGIQWATGEVNAEVPPNLKESAPGAMTNPTYVPQKPANPAPAPKTPAGATTAR